MGPKSGAETQSYTPVKHLSWIDRMYQKLEDIYVEVDNKPSLLIQVDLIIIYLPMFLGC